MSSGWPESWRGADLGRLLLVAGQFVLLVLLFRHYELESPSAGRVMLLALVGFLLQLALPLAYRKWLFLALSVAGVGTVLSASGAAWVLGLGLVLVALCHLPVRFAVRVALVIAAGLALAMMRGGWIAAPFPRGVWVILGSFFMFRMIVYLYDLRHHPKVKPSDVLAYFFLLPNVCFPLFPVVDYRTFTDSYHSRPALQIYQQGVHWMVRGVVHLLLFRLVYYHFVLGPEQVSNVGELVQFLLANILLYLRVSGQFHLIVGMLKMFGWDLPEANQLYFLASSFNEYWRRINIYWKNFMTKIFYLPTYMALAGRGTSQTAAVAIATVGVFVISWQLHSYQYFWLQGVYPVRSVDALFWGAVGLLVLANTLREVNRRQRRFISGRAWSAREMAIGTLKTLGTFSVICVLWSLWTSDSVTEWWEMMRSAAVWGGPAWLPATLLGLLAGAGLVAAWSRFAAARWPFSGRSTVTAPTLLVLLALAQPGVQALMGERAAEVVAGLGQEDLSEQDRNRLVRGYYERVQEIGRLDSPLWELFEQAAAEEEPQRVRRERSVGRPGEHLEAEESEPRPDLFEATGDFLYTRMIPGAQGVSKKVPFIINRWGMRDRDYELEKPEGVIRIAILGASHVMGTGVTHEQIFHEIVEDRLQSEGLPGVDAQFELLAFAIHGSSALTQSYVLEERAFRFDLDVALYLGHLSDAELIILHLSRVVRLGTPIPDPTVARIVEEQGVTGEMEHAEIRVRLLPRGEELVSHSYQRMAEVCRARGVLPVYVFMPRLRERLATMSRKEYMEIASAAGMETLSMAGAYLSPEGGKDVRGLTRARWDFHPNIKGHQMVADRLWEVLNEAGPWLFAGRDRGSREE